MNKSNIATIAKKEFFSFINNPLAYTIVVPFLLISVFIYLRSVLVVGNASLRPYFELLPWFLLLLAPALSMKLLTDEYRSNTLELLFAHPLTELEVTIGKFSGALLFFACILMSTISLPITLLVFSKPDLGQIAGQYIGAFFVGWTFLSVGIAASAYVKNAVSSFLLSASVSFLLIIVGFDLVTLTLPYPFNRIAGEISVMTHMDNIAKGLLDIRDIFYFLSVTSIFLVAAIYKLSERKIAENRSEKRKLSLAFILIAAIGILANILLSSYPIRLDMTQAKLYTLSQGTRQTIANLPDIVTINFYASRDLPVQLQLTVQEITDLLKDYGRLGRNINVRLLHPDVDPEAAQEAQSGGIRQMTFNRIGSGKFEAQTGYLGMVVRFGDKTETIPFIQETDDLEYQLTRRIRKITSDKERTVGVMKSTAEPNQLFDRILTTQYKTETIDSNTKDKIGDGISALVVIDDGSKESTASSVISDYLNGEGNVLFIASGVSIEPQSLSAKKSVSKLASFLPDYGVTLENNLVYDLQLNELISFGRGNTQYLIPYPYWIRALPAETDFSPLSTVKNITLGWPSSLKLNQKEGYTYKQLLTTGVNSGKTEGNFIISPDAIKNLSPKAKDKIPVAVLVEKGDMRLVVVAGSSVAGDQMLSNNRDNIAFLSNTVDWLAQEKDVTGIPSKSAGRSVFEFRNPSDIMLVQWGNLLGPPAAIILFALYYLRRRKLMTQRSL